MRVTALVANLGASCFVFRPWSCHVPPVPFPISLPSDSLAALQSRAWIRASLGFLAPLRGLVLSLFFFVSPQPLFPFSPSVAAEDLLAMEAPSRQKGTGAGRWTRRQAHGGERAKPLCCSHPAFPSREAAGSAALPLPGRGGDNLHRLDPLLLLPLPPGLPINFKQKAPASRPSAAKHRPKPEIRRHTGVQRCPVSLLTPTPSPRPLATGLNLPAFLPLLQFQSLSFFLLSFPPPCFPSLRLTSLFFLFSFYCTIQFSISFFFSIFFCFHFSNNMHFFLPSILILYSYLLFLLPQPLPLTVSFHACQHEAIKVQPNFQGAEYLINFRCFFFPDGALPLH